MFSYPKPHEIDTFIYYVWEAVWQQDQENI